MEFISLEEKHNWQIPNKRIYTEGDLNSFHKSIAFLRLQKVILTISQQISNIEIPSNPIISSHVAAVCSILSDLFKIHLETPPIVGPRRFGNFAARDWHSKVESQIIDILKLHLSPIVPTHADIDGFLNESTPYLLNSFGSATRLDYGTGHELSFVSWLGSLFMVHILPVETSGSELLWILSNYYELVKSLILKYTLEPAGSHGVWGLDDHFHLSYFFGACQMISYKDVFPPPEELNLGIITFNDNNITNNVTVQSNVESNIFNVPNVKNSSPSLQSECKQIAPSPISTLSMDTINKLKGKNLYFSSLSFVFTVKKGPFHEHSPILYNIAAAAKTWEKVARGLWRMYSDEVIGKWPVVQHFWFGGVLYPWVSASDALKSYRIYQNKTLVYDYEEEFKWSELHSTFGAEISTRERENVEEPFSKMERPIGVPNSKRNPPNIHQSHTSILRISRK